MKNPFKAAGSAVASMYKGTTLEGELPPANPVAIIITPIVPIVASVAFIAAFFQKAEPKVTAFQPTGNEPPVAPPNDWIKKGG